MEKKYEVGGVAAIRTLVVMSLLYFMNFADRSIFSVALQPIKQAFHMSDSQAGLLAGLVVFGISILTIPASIFGDRWARRKVIPVMGLIWSLFTLGTGIATQLWQLFVSRFMVGAGEAGYAPAGMTWLSVSFRKEVRALIITIFIAVGQLGAVSGLIFGGLLITATHNWRTPFYIFALPGIILAIITWFLPDYKVVKQEGESALSKAYFRDWVTIFKIKSFWLIVASWTFMWFVVFSLQAWVPALLMRGYHMTAAQAGLNFGLIVLMALFAPLGAAMADRWQKSNKNGRPYYIALTAFLGLALMMITLLSLGSPVKVFVAIFAVTWLFFIFSVTGLMAICNDVTPTRLRSTAIGIATFTAQLLGSTIGTYIVGVISDALGGGAHGIQWGLMWTLPSGALSVVAILILLKFYASDSAKVSDELVAER